MTSFQPDPLPIRHWMNDRPGPLRQLLGRASLLAAATRQLHSEIPSPWARSLRIVNLRGSTLVVYAHTAAALIPLRRHQQDVLDIAGRCLGCRPDRIDAKVRPIPREGRV
jgi:hypothetical protein